MAHALLPCHLASFLQNSISGRAVWQKLIAMLVSELCKLWVCFACLQQAMCCSYRVFEEQALAVGDQPSSTLGTALNAPTPDEDIFVAVEFSLALPPGFRETEVLPPKPVEPRTGFGSFGMCSKFTMHAHHVCICHVFKLISTADASFWKCVHHSIAC